MKILMTLLLFSTFFTACNTETPKVKDNTSSEVLERIAIPFREHGYSELASKIISSQEGLDRFLQRVKRQANWNNKPAFIKVLRAKKVDFSKWNLLLYRMTEGSGSVGLDVQIKQANRNDIIINIHRTVPQMGTADMAYYMLAYKVDKLVHRVNFEGGKHTVRIRNKKADMLVPDNCVAWFDGCNRCAKRDGGRAVCTMMACLVYRPQDFRCTKWEK